VKMSAPFFQSLSTARWLWVVFAVFTLTVLHGAYYTYLVLPRIYVAYAQIQVFSQGSDERNGMNSDSTSQHSAIEFMRSADFLLPIINDLGLDKTWAKRVYKSGLDALPPKDSLSYMSNIVRFDILPRTNIIDIRVASEVPKEASDIANAIADRYEILREIEKDQHNSGGIDTLHDQIAAQQKAIDETKADLEKLRAKLGQIGIPIAPGPGGLTKADLDASKENLPDGKGGQENTNDLELFRDAQHQLDRQQGVLDDLNARLKQARPGSPIEESPARIISRAKPPEHPSLPNNVLNLALSVYWGFALGVGIAFLIEIAFWCVPLTGITSRSAKRTHNPSDEY
jgi:uncharacterized protein involved in exopolysaccharide biosynthesis